MRRRATKWEHEPPVEAAGRGCGQGPARHRRSVAEEITLILDTAEAFKEIGGAADQEGAGAARQDGRQPVLRAEHAHAHVVRDRREAAVRRHAEHRGRASSVLKGETLVDTALNLEAMAPDMIVLRHASSGARHLLARICRSASSTPATACTSTRPRRCSTPSPSASTRAALAGLKVAIVGDLLHSRVLRSNMLLLTKLGAKVWVCGPPTLLPPGIERSASR